MNNLNASLTLTLSERKTRQKTNSKWKLAPFCFTNFPLGLGLPLKRLYWPWGTTLYYSDISGAYPWICFYWYTGYTGSLTLSRRAARVNWRLFLLLIFVTHPLPSLIVSAWGAEYCNEHDCLSVCRSVSLHEYLKNHKAEIHQIYAPVTYGRGSRLRYVMYFRFCG